MAQQTNQGNSKVGCTKSKGENQYLGRNFNEKYHPQTCGLVVISLESFKIPR